MKTKTSVLDYNILNIFQFLMGKILEVSNAETFLNNGVAFYMVVLDLYVSLTTYVCDMNQMRTKNYLTIFVLITFWN